MTDQIVTDDRHNMAYARGFTVPDAELGDNPYLTFGERLSWVRGRASARIEREINVIMKEEVKGAEKEETGAGVIKVVRTNTGRYTARGCETCAAGGEGTASAE